MASAWECALHAILGVSHRRASLYPAALHLLLLSSVLPTTLHSIAGFLAIVVPYSVYMAYVESQHHEHEKKFYPHMKYVSLS